MIFLRTIRDSVYFAFSSLITNKLRTFLSLLGITIGIFSIISVMAVLDSLERTIRDNVSSLGNNTVYIQKWPWTFGPEYPWWKYINRPVPSLREYEFIKDNSQLSDACAFIVSTSRTVEYEGKSIDNTGVIVSTPEYDRIWKIELSNGRYFSASETHTGRPVCIIGAEISEELFRGIDPVGKNIKIGGNKVNIIGVIQREGEDMFSNSHDRAVLLPMNYGRTIFDVKNESMDPFITVTAKEGVNIDELQAELNVLMRTIRRLRPMEEEDFALNRASMISQGLDSIFSIIDLAGIIIGGFAILVGGFGIANIMFVSVRERTRIIGIQKAIGAKQYLILIQFLSEAVVLCLIGGLFGLLLVWIGTLIAAGSVEDIKFTISATNIITGLLISVGIGIVSGFAPARAAARLDPVDAINRV
ncbi:MAG: ABC transporter permease [Bacteroidales bacterium]|nr:ABC transporter permease [Bacteroidales bacterium]HOY40082.1 ABC transporter permease [Bacteroidales bacterium]HQP04792.1 ABC transporter permease [Bacteroidales bacterium]